jgi:hypothetical protein
MAEKKVLFLQLEIFLNCAPHLGMCLFIDDIRQEGVSCTTYIVNCNHIDEAITVIREGDFDLVCLESTFTVDIVNQLTAEFPEMPILVGGVNAIALLLHTKIPFAVFGPGRRAITEFLAQFFGGRDFSKVTNLFYKTGQQIDYSGRTQNWDLLEELFPYNPHLDWQYLGPERKSSANTELVSILAGTGCPYSRATKSRVTYDIGQTINRLGYKITQTALKRLEKIFNRLAHGCSFCVFQLQEHKSYGVSSTTDILVRQAQHLSETYSTSAFSIQTENPFPFLNPFIQEVLDRGIPLDFVSIRSRPDTLLKQKTALLHALERAREHDFHFSIEEVGFESSVEEDLARFNKGIEPRTNLQALKLLHEIKEEYETNVSVHVGHGMILFHPWTTLDSLSENLRVMAEYADVFPRFYALDLTLYSEFLPIFLKVAAEELLVPGDYKYGWDYLSKDPLVNRAYELYETLFGFLGPDIPVSDYLNALNFLEDCDVDEILEKHFGFVREEDIG